MFYRWSRIKLIMSELWDPDDETVHMGKCGLERYYEKHCEDYTVRRCFSDLVWTTGEKQFQEKAHEWHMWLRHYVAQFKRWDLTQQTEEILQGKRNYYV